MRPEKYKNIYWTIEFITVCKEFYYVISTTPSMTDFMKYTIRENSLNDAIFKFKTLKRIKY